MKKSVFEVSKLPVLKKIFNGSFSFTVWAYNGNVAATLFGSKLLQLADTKLIITVVVIQLVAISRGHYYE